MVVGGGDGDGNDDGGVGGGVWVFVVVVMVVFVARWKEGKKTICNNSSVLCLLSLGI